MREVLFRGKAKAIAGCPYNNGKSDGEWVFGYIFPDLGAMKIRQFEPDRPECNDYEIDPETVGQYTGLTDKNGKRIFEGDIVRATIERAERCQSPRIENGVIGYDCIGMIGLILYKDKNGENVWSDFFNELSLSGLIEDYYFEIIGNIHDNPELLNGGEDNG